MRGRWSSDRVHPILVLGRLAVWIARRIREHPLISAVYLLALGGLIAVGFVSELDPYGKIGWAAAGLLILLGTVATVVGFANFLVGELRVHGERQHRHLRERFDRDEDQLRSAHRSRERLEARAGKLEAAQAEIKDLAARGATGADAAAGELERLTAEREADKRELSATLNRIADQRAADAESAAAGFERIDTQRAADQEALRALEPRLMAALGSKHETLETELRAELGASRAALETELREAVEDSARGLSRARKALKADRARLAELEAGQTALRGEIQERIASLDAAYREELTVKLHDIAGEQAANTDELRSRLEEIETGRQPEIQGLKVKLSELAARQKFGAEEIEAKLEELTRRTAETEDVDAKLSELAGRAADAKEIEAKLEELAGRTADAKEIEAKLEELAGRTADAKEIEAKLEELAGRTADAKEIEAKLEELAGQTADTQAIEKKLERVAKQGAAEGSALEERLNRLGTKVNRVADRNVSLEILSTLRQVRALWDQRVDGAAARVDGNEHGHALMMAQLIADELDSPGALRGKVLVEVGSTRERDPDQGSTEKLAIFTALTEMRFVTVDMDPANTKRVRTLLRHLNPQAIAVAARGELFLSEWDGPLDYAYLDAFDFYHENHSAERQESYRQHLDTEINDEECWQMHQACAAALIPRMSDGGIVVIDDTWRDDADEYHGKGKLAVPLLLASGFETVSEMPRALALKRTGGGPAQSEADVFEREWQALRQAAEAP